MNALNRQQWLGLIAIAAVALLAADRFVVSPLTRSWKERSQRITDLRRSVQTGTQLLDRESAIRDRWHQMRTNLLAADRSVAESQLLKAFDRWSQDGRIGVTSIKPQSKRTQDDQETLECRVDASGNLAAVTRFLYNIETDPLGVRVESVELTARDDGGEQLTVGIQASGLLSLETKP